MEISGWSGPPHLLRSTAAEQLQRIVRSKAAWLCREQGVQQQVQPSEEHSQKESPELTSQQGPTRLHGQVPGQPSQHQQLQDLTPHQGEVPAGSAACRARRPRIGVLRTSMGAGAVPGFPSGPDGNRGGPQGCSALQIPETLEGSMGAQGVEVFQYVLGDLETPNDVSQQLFAGLRAMDTLMVDAIIVEGVMEQEEGAAVMNRLRKAASTVVLLDERG